MVYNMTSKEKDGEPEKPVDKRIGNKFWMARTKHGRDKIFSTDEILKEACYEYFEWCEDHPLYESELVKFQGTATIKELPKMRAMTIGGLCIFLGIAHKTWIEYRNHKDFSKVITQVEEIIRTQKFEGACADLLNANIIARDLGLSDKIKNEHSGIDGSPIETINRNMTPVEAAKLYKEQIKDA